MSEALTLLVQIVLTVALAIFFVNSRKAKKRALNFKESEGEEL